MSLTRSHPMHLQILRFSQVRPHRRKIWLVGQQAVYDLRDRNEKKAFRETKAAREAGDFDLALVIQEKRALEYLRERKALDRFNFGAPVDFEDSISSDVDVYQHQALLTAGLDPITTAEILDFADLTILIAEILPPPGEAIRSTPRRPGAPSALLPH